ncbi:MAG TPA: ABC transporter permease [Chthoniobacterales bacterium]|nr:ABC transporter permease [Chthoniobacterales bacterium]
MSHLLKDLRYGVRTLLKQPGFTAIAVLTLALGIGANTAIFSVVNAVLLRPLPYQNPDQLIAVYEKRPALGRERGFVSPPDFIDWRAQNTVFANIAAYAPWTANRTDGEEPERIVGTLASADLFPALGVSPSLGRTFSADEDRPNANRVVVIGHRLWQRRFASDPSIVGKPVMLNGNSHVVIGVMPRGFEFPDKQTELWAPLGLDPADTSTRALHSLNVVARLKEGVTLPAARAEMAMISDRLEQEHAVNKGHRANLFPLYAEVVGPVRPALLVLFSAVGVVLLIACVNVANLLLVRGAGRQKEIAIRSALGASRSRIVSQLLAESILLALLGGGLGFLIAVWGTDLLIAISPADTPRLSEIKADQSVLGFTFLATLLPGIVFGLLPAWRLSRPDIMHGLKEGGRSGASDASSSRVRNSLVVSEVALALVLLIGAGLLLKSFVRLRETNPGLDPSGVLTAQVWLPRAKFKEPQQQAAFAREVVQRLEALPGVKSAAAVADLPLSGPGASRYFSIEGAAPTRPGEGRNANFNLATPKYFQTLGIPLVRGRDFDARDIQGAPEVVIINEALARRFFPDEEALGKRIRIGEQPWRTIVGVVGSVRRSGLDIEATPEMCYPILQEPLSFMALVLKTTRDPQTLAADLRNAVRAVDRDQPVFDVKTMDDVVKGSMSSRRLTMVLLVSFAVMAIVLAAIGIYGVISYLVTQRTHEIGVRMALGAQRGDVLRLILGHGMVLAGLGIVLGVMLSLGLTRLLSSFLFGVSSTDPWIFLAVSLLLVVVALLAGYIPGRRATKVDPMIALRAE